MRYDVLRDFDRAKTPAAALSHWNAQADSLHLVGESSNFVYRFTNATGETMYLRLTHQSHRPRDLVQAEVDYVDYLARNRANVTAPVASREGGLVEVIDTPIGQFSAVVFRAATGQPVKWGTDADNRAILFERGKAFGRLHHLAESYDPPGPTRFHWYQDDLWLRPWDLLPAGEDAARAEYRTLLLFLMSRPRLRSTYGLIHGDFGSYNTMRGENGQVVVFDFDDCCYHWFGFDLAVAILAAAGLPDHYRKPYMRVLLDGYASEKSLEGDGPAEVGMFCRLANLCRFTALLRQLDPGNITDEQQKDLDARRALSEPVQWV